MRFLMPGRRDVLHMACSCKYSTRAKRILSCFLHMFIHTIRGKVAEDESGARAQSRVSAQPSASPEFRPTVTELPRANA